MTSRQLYTMLFTLVVCIGCSDYRGISPTAYQYAKALYSVTNRQRTEKLPAVSGQIADAQQRGEITSQEAEWLKAIIDDADQGDWQTAQAETRKMMTDQVR